MTDDGVGAVPDCAPDEGAHDGPCLVVGYDHHPVAHHALLTAAGLARRMGAYLHVVHVRTTADYPVDPDAVVWQAVAADEQRHLARRARAALAASGVPGDYRMCDGGAATELRSAADACDALMVVVGTRSAPLEHLMRGSTAGALERHTDRPLLLVPDPGDDS